MKLEREQANLRFKVFQDQVSGKLDPQSVHYFQGSHNDSDDDDNHSISSINSSRQKGNNKLDDRGIKLDDFIGQGSPEDYLEWERQVEKIAEYKGFDDTQTFKIAYIRLTKNASLWYEGLKAKHRRHGKPKITTWTHLTRKMRDKYVPLDFGQQSYIKLTS